MEGECGVRVYEGNKCGERPTADIAGLICSIRRCAFRLSPRGLKRSASGDPSDVDFVNLLHIFYALFRQRVDDTRDLQDGTIQTKMLE